MIISKDINPNRNLYYIGAKIIEAIKELDSNYIDITKIYEIINKSEKITMPLLILGFDWLFLLNVIGITEKGIKLCL